MTLSHLDDDTLLMVISYLSQGDAVRLSLTSRRVHPFAVRQAVSTLVMVTARRMTATFLYILAGEGSQSDDGHRDEARDDDSDEAIHTAHVHLDAVLEPNFSRRMTPISREFGEHIREYLESSEFTETSPFDDGLLETLAQTLPRVEPESDMASDGVKRLGIHPAAIPLFPRRRRIIYVFPP